MKHGQFKFIVFVLVWRDCICKIPTELGFILGLQELFVFFKAHQYNLLY